MKLSQIILVFVILLLVSDVSGWFRRRRRRRRRRRAAPAPCSWTTCRHEWRNDWSPSIQTGRCTKQSRKAHFITTTHHGVSPCQASSNCSPSTQGRIMCSCKNAYHCPFHPWTNWAKSVPQGSCAKQSRYRDYNTHIRYDVRANDCNGISSSCGSREYKSRTWCSCKYASCTPGEWSSWSDLPSPVSNQCASQERRKRYVIKWLYTQRENDCSGVGPQSCPGDAVEQREKIITCPSLPSPAFGSWNRDECKTKAQVCRSVCQLRCDVVNGFQLKGPDTRECLPSGQWTSPWTSYCQDIRPPSITCPQSISVGTDPGKPTAKITIPSASASDNSGQQPAITNDAGANVKDFVVSSTPHEVHYSARDAAGLTATCTLQITVNDLERPRVASCPTDIKRQTSENEIRVTWPYPEFEDNYDRPPVQLSITSNRNPGILFPWGRYDVVYTATDRAGNKGTCKFYVDVGPVKCTYFEAPAYGVRACNKKTGNSNNIQYEMVCAIQCRDGYSFADPTASETYMCQSDGTWNKLMYGGQLLLPVLPKSKRPWPDCAPQNDAKAVKKKFTCYTGSCLGSDDETLERIKKNFLEAVQNSVLAKYALCIYSNNEDCVTENVKVYCGANSKRGLDSSKNKRVVSFDLVLKDTNPSADKAKEAERLKQLIEDLDTLEKLFKEKLASSGEEVVIQPHNRPVGKGPVIKVKPVFIPWVVKVQTSSSSVACPVGEVVVILPGDKPELERTVCVECPAGTFYNTESQSCELCQDGTYQELTGQTSCVPCPAGKWSAAAHVECFDICQPGEYTVEEESGAINCLMCPIGTYQPNERADSCLPCPSGKTTTRRGVADANDCQ